MPTHEGVLDLPGFKKPVPWIVDLPAGADGARHPKLAVMLAHGAGGDANSGYLQAVAVDIAAADSPCLRFTVCGSSLQHRINVGKALLAAAPTLPGLQHVERWVLAGHSMGARVAASIAGEQSPAVSVAACLLLSYPLHPPGNPAELRDALLHQLHVPTLLVRGSKDPFSTQQQWDAALQGMQAACAWRQHTVEGGDHGLKIGGKGGAMHTAAVLQCVCAAVQQFVREAAQARLAQLSSEQQPAQPQGQQLSSGRGRPSRKGATCASTGKKRARVTSSKETRKPKTAGKRQRRA